jgi:hypothetical protein
MAAALAEPLCLFWGRTNNEKEGTQQGRLTVYRIRPVYELITLLRRVSSRDGSVAAWGTTPVSQDRSTSACVHGHRLIKA